MFKSGIALVLISTLLVPASAQAFTTAEAQVCADKLLTAYNNKTYPKKLLAVEKIIQKAIGGNYRSLTGTDLALAQSVGEEYLRTSFTEPSGEYQYWDLVVEAVEVTINDPGFRVLGEVNVKSPKGSGRYSFLALVTTEGCRVYQVRVADVMTLIDALKTSLGSDKRLNRIYKK
ncbi:hypothetical protein K2P47_00075 [Patescibacteria group bacterium]|nr:hypothetical protein [Patescibacteria group bacterium]